MQAYEVNIITIKDILNNIIEIHSLKKSWEKNQKIIDEENARLKFIESQKIIKLKELLEDEKKLNSLSSELNSLENECASLEKTLAQFTQKKNLVISQKELDSMSKQIETYKNDLKLKSDKLFEQIDEQDKLSQNIADIKMFLTGLTTTTNEIKKEIENTIRLPLSEIERIKIQIENLLSQIPPGHLSTCLNKNKKFPEFKLWMGFIGQGVNQKCPFCHFQIERSLQEAIHRESSLEECPGCSRILLPS